MVHASCNVLLSNHSWSSSLHTIHIVFARYGKGTRDFIQDNHVDDVLAAKWNKEYNNGKLKYYYSHAYPTHTLLHAYSCDIETENVAWRGSVQTTSALFLLIRRLRVKNICNSSLMRILRLRNNSYYDVNKSWPFDNAAYYKKWYMFNRSVD